MTNHCEFTHNQILIPNNELTTKPLLKNMDNKINKTTLPKDYEYACSQFDTKESNIICKMN